MKTKWLRASLVILVAVSVLTLLASCAPASKAPAGTAASGASLAITPPSQVSSKTASFTLAGSGLKPGEKVFLRVALDIDTDISKSVKPVLLVDDKGTFTVTLEGGDLQTFPAGTFTVKLVGRGEQVLATAPMTITKAGK